jgi:hypothetical protein
MSHALFARKFSPSNADSMALLDVIKETLRQEERIDELELAKMLLEQQLGGVTDGMDFAVSGETLEVMDADTGVFMIVLVEDDEQLHETKDDYYNDNNNNALSSSNCLSFPITAGDPMEVTACDPDDQNQRFVKSNCVQIDSSKFTEFRDQEEENQETVEVQAGDGGGRRSSPLQAYCSLRGVVKGKKAVLYCAVLV